MPENEINQAAIHTRDERIAWLSLKMIPELGNRSLLRLVHHFRSPAAVLQAGAKDISAISGLRERAREALQNKEFIRSPSDELNELERTGIRVLCLNDPDYPSNLAAIPDPPAVLFLKGNIEPRDLVSVAVVGSRAASPTGMAFTERLCMELAGNGVCIVSGLAVGIDSAAHRGAIKGNGRTIAVVGCGLDIDYPRANGSLRNDIAENGAVVSEFVMGTPPAPGHFPQRNRIISGLALGVVVVEAAHKSGSLITARLALEQGREVFAVPGMARHYRSVGPHRLLKEGAKLVECAEDILEEIRPLIKTSKEEQKKERTHQIAEDATPDEALVLCVLDQAPKQMDDICRSVALPVPQIMAILLSLELKGIVQQLPGKYFILNA
ncbi:MAG: DNA-processing protein DprA [Syntrophobacteraceae bacterium]